MTNNDEPTGRAKGGKARADKLTPEQRREIAKKGAIARWGAGTLKATHKGNFKNDFGIDVECYVLDDENKTAVISQRGMGEALGLGGFGSRLPRFINGKTISKYIGPELREKLENPLIFQLINPGRDSSTGTNIHGYDVTILIDLCKIIIAAEADGKLTINQTGIAKQAHIILNASAKAGIQGLVYALSGYDRTKEEIITAFKLFVQEEAQKYEKEFPNELYEEWHRIYKIPVPQRGKPWNFKFLTIDHIYYPLAQSNGKILELVRANKAKDGDRKKKLFVFLSEIGTKALRMQLGRVLGMAETSANQEEYERKIRERFGPQKDLF
ncbi:MAG: Uncharacterized protein AWT59_1368 [Candidatus Gallionella acididurans]|uniref:Bacteriophage Mx8 p63 C-terminal domain-containing protein n=1 Tax=Candidatus Gallionella acididurans TaxID=1796491 RepID=A0A139BUZ7_9PROT|nr:MAG: Uncharacterized protein AWT59_1368 [Candidatus Gallionella acididurans]